jgi:hypothetical protein
MLVTTEQDQRVAEQQVRLKDLQRSQLKAAHGDKNAIKKVKGNRDSKFEIPEHESHLVHVYTLSRSLSGDMLSFNDIEKVIAIQPRIFEQMITSGAFAAYTDAKVVHDPRENAPKAYKLKPVEPKLATVTDDAELKAREDALARDKELFEQQKAQFEARLAAIEKGQGFGGSPAVGQGNPPTGADLGEIKLSPEAGAEDVSKKTPPVKEKK